MVNTKIDLCGIAIDNPITPASGTFGFGYEFAEIYDINCLGTFSFKGTTKDARFGNPTPRIAECDMGMINAVGLQNPGVDKVISEELPKLKKCFNKPVMANVSGFSVPDYAYTVEKLNAEAGSTVTFDKVIAVSNDSLKVGADVASATVTATVMEQGRGKKVIVYKYKRKTGYHKKNGHRQAYTQVKIDKINA